MADKSPLVKLTGLWLNKKQDGTPYFAGYLGDAKVLIFKNTNKGNNEKAPDYEMFLAAKERKPAEGGSQPQSQPRQTSRQAAPPQQRAPQGDDGQADENIPF